VLVQQVAVQPFDEAIALRSPDTGRAMLDAFQLQEQFERMLIGPAAIVRSGFGWAVRFLVREKIVFIVMPFQFCSISGFRDS
jgi:hypothetical protein